MCSFVPQVLYTIWLLSKLHTYTNVKTTCKCFQKKKRHRWGLMLVLAYLMPDCWLEVSLHPEGPAIGQLDLGFPWSQGKCWVSTKIPRCTACFTCSPPKGNINNLALMYPWKNSFKCSPSTAVSTRHQDVLTDWLTIGRNVTLTLNWTTLFLGDINPGTWPTGLGESTMRQ
jgi:hypothetical protein